MTTEAPNHPARSGRGRTSRETKPLKTMTLANLPEPLDYFTEWGASSWTKMLEKGIGEISGDLEGRRVLEIGCRRGRVSSLFALLGADVVGVDVSTTHLEAAKAEAVRWGVEDRVSIQKCSAMLDELEPASFDLVFTKSVLVVARPLPPFLERIKQLLVPDGRVLFIENGAGSLPIRLARQLRHRNWKSWNECDFFNGKKCREITESFVDVRVDYSPLPPVYLFRGRNPS